MLVTFSCKASGNVVMFGDVAMQMLKMMGHSEMIPGAINAEDIPIALANLQQAVARIHNQQEDAHQDIDTRVSSNDANDDFDTDPVIGLNTRALPLIEMLKAADKEQCHIMWE